MFASSFTRLTVTPGCALSNSLISRSVNRVLRKLGIATVSFTLVSVSAGAWVGDVLLVEPVDVLEHALNNTAPATTTTTIGTIFSAKRFTFIRVLPHLQLSELHRNHCTAKLIG